MRSVAVLSAGGHRRDRLLVAAQDLLATGGVAALTVAEVARRAAVDSAGFYGCYADIDDLLDDLATLFIARHGVTIAAIHRDEADPAMLFARIIRQTLRLLTSNAAFGRLLFDAGLPIDRFVAGLRATLLADIVNGAASEAFVIDDSDIVSSVVIGTVIGAALDIHRGRLRPEAIEVLTARMLETLGLARAEARRLAFADVRFIAPPPLPMRWASLRAAPVAAG